MSDLTELTGLTDEDRRLLDEARAEFEGAGTAAALEAARVKYLGRKAGLVQSRFENLKSAPNEDRARLGRSANALRKAVEAALAEAKARAATAPAEVHATVDLTLPGRRAETGHRHVLSRTTELLVDVAATLGFSVAEGPEVELEANNFDALNIPLEHPSYDPFDTFYIETAPGEPKRVLRSHTSPVQVRAMKEATRDGAIADPPPLRVVVPGRTYRPDKVDATHYHTFHQLEGLAVDADITFLDLKYTLDLFAKGVFGEDTKTRFRPSYFPFTEPSAEVDVSCIFCERDGSACPVCKATGWLEILGCGMVHPKVLANGGYDPERFTGFAFGMGIERIAMLRHGIRDIRLFIDPERGNDLRFLAQF
ncbi:MAG: phenylalanine--tRNA ligase subunit alpha [Planctomycetota bacterium]|jgi:phenylalanyl-tRNA synthetase alpha chain